MNSHLTRVSKLIENAIAGLSAEELAWHREDKWSAAEILEHLSRTFAGTAKGTQKVLEAGKPDCRCMTFRDHLLRIGVVKLGYMPKGRKSPENVRPRGMQPLEAVAAIRENLKQMEQGIACCEERFGTRVKIMNHPILGPLTTQEFCKFHFVHTRHHMKQIENLRAQMQAETIAKPASA